MPRFYCIKCGSDFPGERARCPACGADIEEFFATHDYVDKLIAALRHPEPNTPIRAAWILGRIGDRRAVEPLMETVRTTRDAFIARAAVESLAAIGTDDAMEFLSSIKSHPSVIIREAVARQLDGAKKKD